jgi:hypothetical protein
VVVHRVHFVHAVWLISFVITHLGRQLTESEALAMVQHLSKAGHLVIDDKGKLAYHLN